MTERLTSVLAVIGAVTGVIGTISSIVGAIRQTRLQQASSRWQERLGNLEMFREAERRTPRVIATVDTTASELRIENRGEVDLYSVRLQFIETERSPGPVYSDDSCFPLRVLEPGQSFPMHVVLADHHWPPFEATVQFSTDPSGAAVQTKRVFVTER